MSTAISVTLGAKYLWCSDPHAGGLGLCGRTRAEGFPNKGGFVPLPSYRGALH